MLRLSLIKLQILRSARKNSEEDAYSRFLSEHGGHTNAYTAAENTNYHFECNSDSLAEALDRFSQVPQCTDLLCDALLRHACMEWPNAEFLRAACRSSSSARSSQRMAWSGRSTPLTRSASPHYLFWHAGSYVAHAAQQSGSDAHQTRERA